MLLVLFCFSVITPLHSHFLKCWLVVFMIVFSAHMSRKIKPFYTWTILSHVCPDHFPVVKPLQCHSCACAVLLDSWAYKLCGQTALHSAASFPWSGKAAGFKALQMRWFGFGFNGFGQICVHEESVVGRDTVKEVKVIDPTEISGHVNRSVCRQTICKKTSEIRASWSRRASLHLDGTFINF